MTNLRARLRNGEVVFGQMALELFTPGIGPMLAAAGMEFVIYDMEHGRCDIGPAGGDDCFLPGKRDSSDGEGPGRRISPACHAFWIWAPGV